MQRWLRWLDRATLLRMDYRAHCSTCGVTIAAFSHLDLVVLLEQHELGHLEVWPDFCTVPGCGYPAVDHDHS